MLSGFFEFFWDLKKIDMLKKLKLKHFIESLKNAKKKEKSNWSQTQKLVTIFHQKGRMALFDIYSSTVWCHLRDFFIWETVSYWALNCNIFLLRCTVSARILLEKYFWVGFMKDFYRWGFNGKSLMHLWHRQTSKIPLLEP